MFNLICVLIIAVIGTVGLLIPVQEINHVGIGVLSFSIFWLFVSFVNNLVCFTQQVERFEKLRGKLKIIKLQKERQDDLMGEFKLYLAITYPEIEKDVFNKICNIKTDINAVLSYPEIKSSETLIELVKRLDQLSNNLYNVKSNFEQDCAIIRYFNNNKWFMFMPQIPEDVLKVL